MSSWKAIIAPKKKLHGIDDELQKLLDANMDDVSARRRARAAFKGIQLSIDHILFKTPSNGLKIEESYEVNSRGLSIFSKSWIPVTVRPKAMVCYCHGYGDTCTFFFEGIARKFALLGYSVFAMDYPGFGLSEGLHGFIPNFDRIVDDVIEHYSKVKGHPTIIWRDDVDFDCKNLEQQNSDMHVVILYTSLEGIRYDMISRMCLMSCIILASKDIGGSFVCVVLGSPSSGLAVSKHE